MHDRPYQIWLAFILHIEIVSIIHAQCERDVMVFLKIDRRVRSLQRNDWSGVAAIFPAVGFKSCPNLHIGFLGVTWNSMNESRNKNCKTYIENERQSKRTFNLKMHTFRYNF